jgi:hypothetical protein
MHDSKSIVDTIPSFLASVQASQPATVDQWLTCWKERYMSQWPALYEMVVTDYTQQGDDWRQIARERVFPGMNAKLVAMESAYKNLIGMIESIEQRARQKFGYSGDVAYLLYVGLGNGAGWVTRYDGHLAVLFGLEGIVDSGFDETKRLEGLVAHELGHVLHHSWREDGDLTLGSGPWWQLYEEGFAQFCESEILNTDSYHMRDSSLGNDWLAWCQEHLAWLASEFMRLADQGQSVRPFFGSWYDVSGRKQTGYFLGRQVINHLNRSMPLATIALLKDGLALQDTVRGILFEFATESAQ